MVHRLKAVKKVKPALRVYPDLQVLSRELATDIARLIKDTIKAKGRFSIALAGGSSPQTLYRLLATEYAEQITWSQVHFFWGDERYVSYDSPSSNYNMARETLLKLIAVPAENVHPMPTNLSSPEEAAKAYENTLRRLFPAPWPCFDLILLGIGADGHTASLFPGSPAIDERKAWVVAVRAPVEPSLRLSLTLPAVNHAKQVYFLASGADKAPAVRLALRKPPDPARCPASAVQPHGSLAWWLDQDAARMTEVLRP